MSEDHCFGKHVCDTRMTIYIHSLFKKEMDLKDVCARMYDRGYRYASFQEPNSYTNQNILEIKKPIPNCFSQKPTNCVYFSRLHEVRPENDSENENPTMNQILPESYLHLEIAGKRRVKKIKNHHIVFAKFNGAELLNIEFMEEVMNRLAGEKIKHFSFPLGYNWNGLQILGGGLYTKPSVPWNPSLMWEVNTVCVWDQNAIISNSAVIYKNCGDFKYDQDSEEKLILA